jgi:hypothetical protein
MDNLWEDTFHVDKPPYAGNERTDEFWPKEIAGYLWWDEGPPPDLHLHTDGYGHGELNCWIAPIPCGWLSYQGAKLRIRDDINNWRRSDELAWGASAGVEIINCPLDEIAYDDPVELNAQITGNSFYAPLVKWSVQVEVEPGQWVDYGPHEDIDHQYSGSGYDSVISEDIENWTGPNFSIEHFRDCEMRVRARLDVCGETFDDICDLQGDSDYEVEALQIIKFLTDNGSQEGGDGGNAVRRDFCEIPGDDTNPDVTTTGILEREVTTGEVCLSIYAAIDICLCPPQYIEVTVESTDPYSSPLTVYLYKIRWPSGTVHENLDPANVGDLAVQSNSSDSTGSLALGQDDNNVFLKAMYAGTDIDWVEKANGRDYIIYGRGPVIYYDQNGLSHNGNAAPVVISDTHENDSGDKYNPSIPPYFFVTSNDQHIGGLTLNENRAYGVQGQDDSQTHDQAALQVGANIFVCFASDYEFYGERRGKGNVIESENNTCDDEDLLAPPWFNDPTYLTPTHNSGLPQGGGIERLIVHQISLPYSELFASCPIQSEADVMVVDSHGMESEQGPGYGTLGDFFPGRDLYHSNCKWIEPYDFRSTNWRDLEWLALIGCMTLDDGAGRGAEQWYSWAVDGNSDVDDYRYRLRSVVGFYVEVSVSPLNILQRHAMMVQYGLALQGFCDGNVVNVEDIRWFEDLPGGGSRRVEDPRDAFFSDADLSCLAWMQSLNLQYGSGYFGGAWGHDQYAGVQTLQDGTGVRWYSDYSEWDLDIIYADPDFASVQPRFRWDIHRETIF